MNKKKRFTIMAALVMSIVLLTAGSAYASKSKDYQFKYANAYVHGYVDFASYFGGLNTKVWSNISLGGVDRDVVSANYTLKTDKKIIGKNTLKAGKLSASYTAESGGMFATYARLTIKYDGKTKNLTDK